MKARHLRRKQKVSEKEPAKDANLPEEIRLIRREFFGNIKLMFVQLVEPRPEIKSDATVKKFDAEFYAKDHKFDDVQSEVLSSMDEYSKLKYNESASSLITVESKAEWLMTLLIGLCGFAVYNKDEVTEQLASVVCWCLGVCSALPGMILCLRTRLPGDVGAASTLHDVVNFVEESNEYRKAVSENDPSSVPTPLLTSHKMHVVKSRASAIVAMRTLVLWKSNSVRAASYWLVTAVIFLVVAEGVNILRPKSQQNKTTISFEF
jgi:hypothetical protein